MKLFYQIILGLVLIFAIMSSVTNAKSLEDDDATDESDESLIGDAESIESSPQDVQQDYLNVGDYVRPPPPWWF
ncbi:uncharacterized protein LOC108137110 [Drosophila elegans]|uniref:uncharacterized protein LOC108137110 n=1 Tax=Drosophila elegans TaxID=30023 RepID=UPI0007E5F3FB|nr:uncharacterized protein LOC108137110 [Drosophila elegans]